MDKDGVVRWLSRLGQLYRQLEEMETMLQVLSPQERLVLDRMVIRPREKAAEQLCQMLEIEKSSVYRRKDRALNKLGRMLDSWKIGEY